MYESELQTYLLEPIEVKDFELLDWWRVNKKRFPRLHKLFVKCACIPATSSICESEFSYTGMVITDRRSRLLPDNVNNLMVVRNEI